MLTSKAKWNVNVTLLKSCHAKSTHSTSNKRVRGTLSPVSQSLNHSQLRTYPRRHLTLLSTLTVLPKIQHHPSSPPTTIRVPPPGTQNAGRRPYLIRDHHDLLHKILPTLFSMPPTPHHNVLPHTNALPMPAHRQHGEP